MTSLVIPKGVTSIGEGAFAGCGGLTSIIVEEGNPVYDSRNNCNAIISTADNKLITGCENTVIPNEIVSIGYAAFARCGMKSISIPNGVTSIGDYAFNYCQDLASIVIPNSVTAIGYYAFIGTAWYNNQPDGLVYAGKVLIEYKGDEAMPENTEIVIEEGTLGIASFAFNFENNNFGKPSYQNSWKMKSVTLPNSLVYIGERAFASCYGLSDVYCYAKNVPTAETDAFAWLDFENATLHVPAGSVSAYQAADPWNQFKNIVEMDLSPIDGGETIDFSSNIGEGTDLNGNVVGDIYYNISAGDGSYNAAEGCIVVTTPTDDSSISGQDIFGEDFKDGFTGIVFKVPAGKGSVKVEAQTTGTMVLKVKIGNNDPIEMELEGRLKVSFPYNVTEPTYVYIYGGSNSSQARSNRAGGTDGELKLYGIEVTKEESGIDTVHSSPFGSVASHSQFTVHSYYTLDGRKLDGVPAKKGVYIVNGRKVVIK